MPPSYFVPALVVTPNTIRIRLRYSDIDTFVEKFAPNVTRGGVFLASRNIRPVGELIGFEIQLVTGAVALAGQGRVTWVKEFNPAEPNRPYGMGVQFVNVAPACRQTLARVLRSKDANAPVPRGLSGMHATLVAVAAQAATADGVRSPEPIDTNVDLANEYGIDEAMMARVLDGRWRLTGRPEDDLADLLRPEPLEAATLAQALSELPRLVDPQISRRRAASGFRVVEPPAIPVLAVAEIPETPPMSRATPAGVAEETTAPTLLGAERPTSAPAEDLGAVPEQIPRESSSGASSGTGSGSGPQGKRRRR